MINQELRDTIKDAYPESLLFENPAYDNAIIGVSSQGAFIYSYDLMVEELSQEDHIDPGEAAEFIDYNTIRALSYLNNSLGIPPIVMYDISSVH